VHVISFPVAQSFTRFERLKGGVGEKHIFFIKRELEIFNPRRKYRLEAWVLLFQDCSTNWYVGLGGCGATMSISNYHGRKC